MNYAQGHSVHFSEQLRLEADRVLEDLVFKRSPVQSKLFRYLVDTTLRGGASPGQYEIAVDALGKNPDFDLTNDSYPRVQISRLRTNLDNYYARNAPIGAVRIILEPGQYRLDLQRFETPQTRMAASDQNSSQASPAPMVDEGSRGPGISYPADQDVDIDTPETITQLTPAGRRWRERALGRRNLVFALVAIIAVLVGAGIYAFNSPLFGLQEDASSDGTEPIIALRTDISAIPDTGSPVKTEIELAINIAEMQLASSWISRPYIENSSKVPDYTLQINFGRGTLSELNAFITLYSPDSDVLFTDYVNYDPANPKEFGRDIEAALIYLTSPAGIISERRFEQIGADPESAYDCFIVIENLRSEGARTANLVDQCIDEYDDSKFSPFFRARRAFSYYQQQRLAGEPILREGAGWTDLSASLQKDRFNGFANFTAAKVELANDNCSGALGHVERARQQSASYPAMLAALEAETSSCKDYSKNVVLTDSQLRAMIERNPAPDALLHLYFLIAALSIDDVETARVLSKRTRLAAAAGPEEDLIELLHTGLEDRSFVKANEERIRARLRMFIWSDRGVERVIDSLTKNPT